MGWNNSSFPFLRPFIMVISPAQCFIRNCTIIYNGFYVPTINVFHTKLHNTIQHSTVFFVSPAGWHTQSATSRFHVCTEETPECQRLSTFYKVIPYWVITPISIGLFHPMTHLFSAIYKGPTVVMGPCKWPSNEDSFFPSQKTAIPVAEQWNKAMTSVVGL